MLVEYSAIVVDSNSNEIKQRTCTFYSEPSEILKTVVRLGKPRKIFDQDNKKVVYDENETTKKNSELLGTPEEKIGELLNCFT